MRLLARREHSLRELTAKLVDRGLPQELVEEVVAELADEGLASDERFAESFVDLRMERGDGPVKLRRALRERGIADALIDRYLPADTGFWQHRAAQVSGHRFGPRPPRDRRDWLRRARFLERRGFTAEQVRAALGEGEDD